MARFGVLKRSASLLAWRRRPQSSNPPLLQSSESSNPLNPLNPPILSAPAPPPPARASESARTPKAQEPDIPTPPKPPDSAHPAPCSARTRPIAVPPTNRAGPLLRPCKSADVPSASQVGVNLSKVSFKGRTNPGKVQISLEMEVISRFLAPANERREHLIVNH